MTYDLPNLRSTARRQLRLGNMAIILLGVWLIMPYLVDRYRGEPTISTSLSAYSEADNVYIAETLTVKYPNRGTRNNIVLDEQDRIVCIKNFSSYWDVTKDYEWSMEAFTSCDTPENPFRVCSIFNVLGKSGIERKFGAGREFCTDMIYPHKEQIDEDHA